MQEEILLQRYKKGTHTTFFNTKLTEDNYTTSTLPAVLYLNNIGNPVKMIVSDKITSDTSTILSNGLEVWTISSNDNINKLQDILPGGSLLSGRTFSQKLEYVISDENRIKTKFEKSMQEKFSGTSESFVFSETKELEDFDISIKLERSTDVLNTLNTYNKTYNELPQKESKTGVVFGKLVARQKIKDSDGNFVNIPLKGISVAIFNSSDRFPSTTSLSKSGERIRMVFKDANGPNENMYANPSSFELDNKILLDKDTYLIEGAGLTNRHLLFPDEFKYSTVTNENGEFILQDIPVGPQVLMFEVNLLQQGLSSEEVSLNFFPYRGDNIANIDEVPHYYFRNLPIDVVPSWGTLQTGYTEVNITANLDLRKWTTYFFPPVGAKIKNKGDDFFNTGSYPEYPALHARDYGIKVLDRTGFHHDSWDWPHKNIFVKLGDPYLQSKNPASLTIKVRDMTKLSEDEHVSGNVDDASNTNIQMVEVNNVMNRNSIGAFQWENEFSQVKNKAQFNSFGYHVIKLPANLYDPEGKRTEGNGDEKPGSHKGVWLTAYQFKMFHLSENNSYRTTGFDRLGVKESRDNYHLNLTYPRQFNDKISSDVVLTSRIAPFKKSWTINYPNKYSIPKMPVDPIPIKYFDSGNQGCVSSTTSNLIVLSAPRFKDGFKVKINGGYKASSSSIKQGMGGFGLSNTTDDHETLATLGMHNNTFNSSVTNGSLYLYEKSKQDFGKYANGYSQTTSNYGDCQYANNSLTPSEVLNGEKYQRVECGHAYYLHPSGSPLIGTASAVSGEAEIDFMTRYHSSSAAFGIFTTRWIGYQYEDELFYYDKQLHLSSILFDGGKTLGLILDYDLSDETYVTNNQGSFSMYRIADENSNLSPEEVFEDLSEEDVTRYEGELNLHYIRIQNENAGGHGNLRKGDNDKDFHLGTSTSDYGSAYVQVTNNEDLAVDVTVGDSTKLVPGQGTVKFYLSETGAWANKVIKFVTNGDMNDSVEGVEGKKQYLRFNYTFSFLNVKNARNIESHYNLNLNEDSNRDLNSPDIFHIRQRIYNIDTEYFSGNWIASSSCSSTFWYERSVSIEGMYFCKTEADTTNTSSISIARTRLTNLTCTNNGGFKL